MTPHRAPYWRLSAFYLFYFGSLGTLVPYWGLYLQSLGFEPAAIGELMAIIMVTRVVAPNVWGWTADRLGRRMPIVRLGFLLAVAAFAGTFFGTSYAWLALVMSAFSFFWNAGLPQVEATTLNHLGADAHRYSLVRLWGSIGFIAAVVTLGPLLDRHGPSLILPVLLGLYAGIFLATLAIREAPSQGRCRVTGRFRRVLLRPEVLAFLGTCLLIQASHGPYYAFYSIYLQDHGYSRGVIGQLWALGVVAEIGVFLTMGRLLDRFSPRHLLLASLLLAALRWVLIGLYVDHLAVLVAAQVLHAATFGVFHAVSMHLVHQYFSGPHQGRGQALYSSLSFGAGGALGSLAAGHLWRGIGPAATYLVATGVALTAFVLVFVGLRDGAGGAAQAHVREGVPEAGRPSR
jgi:PPP family 3-phenylpropionic acid transporter